MALSSTEQLHNLAMQMYHAVGTGAVHVPYQKPLHDRMSHPKVGDTVTYRGRLLDGTFDSSLTGTLLQIDTSDTTRPRQAILAPLDRPDLETFTRYDKLIALPVTSPIAGPNNTWATITDPIPVHLLRCVDEEAAEAVRLAVDAEGWTGDRYGSNLLFAATSLDAVAELAEMAEETHWATEAEAAAMVARIPGGVNSNG